MIEMLYFFPVKMSANLSFWVFTQVQDAPLYGDGGRVTAGAEDVGLKKVELTVTETKIE